MPDSYGISFTLLRTCLPSRYDAVSSPAASAIASRAWTKTGKYVSVNEVGMPVREEKPKPDYNWYKTRVSTNMPIQIVVNGQPQSAPEGQTILGLLRQLDLDPARVAPSSSSLACSIAAPPRSPSPSDTPKPSRRSPASPSR